MTSLTTAPSGPRSGESHSASNPRRDRVLVRCRSNALPISLPSSSSCSVWVSGPRVVYFPLPETVSTAMSSSAIFGFGFGLDLRVDGQVGQDPSTASAAFPPARPSPTPSTVERARRDLIDPVPLPRRGSGRRLAVASTVQSRRIGGSTTRRSDALPWRIRLAFDQRRSVRPRDDTVSVSTIKRLDFLLCPDRSTSMTNPPLPILQTHKQKIKGPQTERFPLPVRR